MNQMNAMEKAATAQEQRERGLSVMATGLTGFLSSLPVELEHVLETPSRVARVLEEITAGYAVDPAELLSTTFAYTGSQMIHVRDVPVFSTCSHHMLPIIGLAHFAYVPHGRVVGLSKIPRFIDCLARRLQVQETLTDQIVDTFMSAVAPHGCGVMVKALHCCMVTRGVRARGAIMQTLALRGSFQTIDIQRQEFMSALKQDSEIL